MSTASDALGLLQDPEGSLQPSVPINANADAVGALLAGAATRTLTADANYTLVAADYRVATLVLTSSVLTAGRDIVFPAYFPPMLVVNDTGQTLTLKKSGQTGVTVDDGESIRVNCGPTDVLASTVGGSGGGVTSVNGATGAVVLELDKVTINTEASTSTMTPATHAGLRKYNRCADDVTFSSGQSYAAGQVYNIRATAALSLVESGVTLTEPAGGTLDLDAGMSVTVIMTSATAGDVIGQTVPA